MSGDEMRRSQRFAEMVARQDAAYSGPTGSWAQRWLPFVCKHKRIRCTHGDEIVARRWRRRVCMICGRALGGPIPPICWFTGRSHARAAVVPATTDEAQNGD